MVTLLQLKYFCAACSCGSVTKAAKKLFVTQPTITSAIRELEKEYGLQLLEHRGRKLELTGTGAVFYQKAAALLASVDVFDEEIRQLERGHCCVRLGMTKLTGSNVWAEYFPYGVQNHSDIDVITRSGSSAELLELLREGQLDAAIVPTQSEGSLDDLEKEPLVEMRMLYCLPENHPLADRKTLLVSDIAGERMISTVRDKNKQIVLSQLFSEAGFSDEPRVVQRCEQVSTVLEMIRAGAGTGYFPEPVIRSHKGIVGKPISGDHPIHVYVVWTKLSGQRGEVKRLLRSMREYFSEK